MELFGPLNNVQFTIPKGAIFKYFRLGAAREIPAVLLKLAKMSFMINIVIWLMVN
jgi:hypothetical protein